MKKIIHLGEKLWASKSAFNYNYKAPYAYIIFEKASSDLSYGLSILTRGGKSMHVNVWIGY